MDLEQKAIERLRLASQMAKQIYNDRLVITYSGGKDSDVLLHLAKKSGIDFEVLHSLTTVDAPETVHHVQKVFADYEDAGTKCVIDKHVKPDGSRTTMWNLIRKKSFPPTRVVRYCCSELKESGGMGRFIATGVRWSESSKRKNSRDVLEFNHRNPEHRIRLNLNNDNDEDRRLFETCQLKGKRVVNPIVDWKAADIWDYIHSEGIKTNPLYECGFSRVGCIGCPMARVHQRQFEFERYPRFKNAYIAAFNRMIQNRRERERDLAPGRAMGTTGESVFEWWLSGEAGNK